MHGYGFATEEVHYLSDTASNDKSGRSENKKEAHRRKKVQSHMKDQGSDLAYHQGQEESLRLGAA